MAAEAQPPLVTRVHGIATGIAACWRPPHRHDQVTVRVSFTQDGAVIGEPRIVYAQSSVRGGDDAKLAQSMLKAIRACTPLHFSGELGSAIAGQVLDIRFIGRNGRPSSPRPENLERVLPAPGASPRIALRLR